MTLSMNPRLAIFDLDNTLAVSKQPLDAAMADALTRLLVLMPVAVISGGSFEQLATQVASQLSFVSLLSQLYLLPTSGAALYSFDSGVWNTEYEELLSREERDTVVQALETGAAATGLVDFRAPIHGPYIEDRGSQVSLSALGQMAPIGEKEAWDPTHEKREKLQAAIAPLLSGFTVKVGGLTTIDVTKKGVDKAFGIRKLSAYLGVPISEMLYIGDELRPGGNDDVVKETGVKTRSVNGPKETREVILELLAA